MASRRKVPVVQIYDGSWYLLGSYVRDVCCDCGMVHDAQFKVEDGKIMFRYTVNAAETAKHRAEQGIKIVRKRCRKN